MSDLNDKEQRACEALIVAAMLGITPEQLEAAMERHNSPKSVIAPFPPSDGRQWNCQCARCGSSCDIEVCEECDGEGVDGHDCGDDCCCCGWPDEDNMVCQYCHGDGDRWTCVSSSYWCQANPLPGRENVERGQIEWFVEE